MHDVAENGATYEHQLVGRMQQLAVASVHGPQLVAPALEDAECFVPAPVSRQLAQISKPFFFSRVRSYGVKGA